MRNHSHMYNRPSQLCICLPNCAPRPPSALLSTGTMQQPSAAARSPCDSAAATRSHPDCSDCPRRRTALATRLAARTNLTMRATVTARSSPLLPLLQLLCWSFVSPLSSALGESVFAGHCGRFDYESERCSAMCAVLYPPSAADVRAKCNVDWTDSTKYFCDIYASYDSRVVCPLVPKEWPTLAGDCDSQFHSATSCSYCPSDPIRCDTDWFDAAVGVPGSRWCSTGSLAERVCPVWRQPPRYLGTCDRANRSLDVGPCTSCAVNDVANPVLL